ncbi:MAG: hypothetical protein M3388_00885 [Acidobacteriota bacterium]|nr:hypothetical protein [Acidobacteriota bacterium]
METCLTIYVTFEGLGFCCFNPKRQGAEMAFLRLPKHNLKIKITGSDGRQQIFDKIADNAKIELISQGTTVKGFRLNNDGEFDRQKGLDSENDPFDLRWLVDFEGAELHDQKATPQNQIPGSVRGLTKMFLPNAYFYTEQVLSANYELEQINVGTGARAIQPFGLIGETLGARVDAVEASLRIDENNVFEFNEGVDPKAVTRFFVTITNVCENPIPQPQSDFQKYYEVMDFEGGLKFDFDLAEKALAYPRPIMCEFTWLSKTKTLAGFF